jgi:hypothetical protein
VGQIKMMNHDSRSMRIDFAGRHSAVLVALLGDDLCLVDGQPAVNPITKRRETTIA